MTSQVKVELPTFTIAPLERSSELYWKLDTGSIERTRPCSSSKRRARGELPEEGRVWGFLRGGNWRTFHWKKLVVGRKLYRIQTGSKASL
jgi:hypothetical protein